MTRDQHDRTTRGQRVPKRSCSAHVGAGPDIRTMKLAWDPRNIDQKCDEVTKTCDREAFPRRGRQVRKSVTKVLIDDASMTAIQMKCRPTQPAAQTASRTVSERLRETDSKAQEDVSDEVDRARSRF